MAAMTPSDPVDPNAVHLSAAHLSASASAPAAAARDSIQGLAFGDAFGERWFRLFRPAEQAVAQIRAREIPAESPWHWTDDTAMALGLLRVLDIHGAVHQSQLAESYAAVYLADTARGYGYGMHRLLPVLAADPDAWRTEARNLFSGEGSLGNGAAMRVAPLGAWFHEDIEEAAEQAVLSAEVTHAHPEGIAGAIAVAVAAALAAGGRSMTPPQPGAMLTQVAELTPPGLIRDGVLRAADLSPDTPAWRAADLLGNGQRIRASDTVPFALWSAAGHLGDLAEALWTTAEGLGDVDTTCAITGGVVAARTGVAALPKAWLERREPLPDWV